MKIVCLLIALMKIACLFIALIAISPSGRQQKVAAEPNEADVNFDKDLEEFYQKAVSLGGGYTLGGSTPGGMKTVVDIANVKLLYANYKSSKKLQAAIEKFDRSSTSLAKKMLYLTYVIAFLTLVMALLTLAMFSLTVVQIVHSSAHNYM